MSFPLDVFRARLSSAADLLRARRPDADTASRADADSAPDAIDGAILTPGPDLRLLLDSDLHTHERFSALTFDSATGEWAIIVPAVDASTIRNGLAGQLGITVHGWTDGQDPYQWIRPGRYAVSSAMTADHLHRLHARGITTAPAADILAPVLISKDAPALEELRRAGRAIDEVHRAVPALLRPGRTEAEVAADLRDLILREHTTVDFIIVGSGPHGADPHHSYSDRILESGDIVVVDIGGTLDSGYHSDCTRTYVIGSPTAEQQRIYDILHRAQQAGVDAATPGTTAGAVDDAVRAVLLEADLGDYILHRTGHGIGLTCHEEPSIMTGVDLPLEPGMAFSIEPGVYLPGSWGARIEDIVIMTDTGVERLNTTPRDLLPTPTPSSDSPTHTSSLADAGSAPSPTAAHPLAADAVRIAREAADLIAERRRALSRGELGVESKSSAVDPVTAVDKESERFIATALRELQPGVAILGEEDEAGGSSDGDKRWIVDPIDGTVNFLYDSQAYAVSLAYEVDGEVVLGVVHDVPRGVTYLGIRGAGAWRSTHATDWESLHCTQVSELGHTLLVTGFAYDADRRRTQGALVADLLPQVRDIRRFGSAALDCCRVAEGSVDAYYEHGLNAWDFAAGALIAAEAGAGVDTPDMAATSADGARIVVAGPGIFPAITEKIAPSVI